MLSETRSKQTRRVFFGLWPDDAIRQQLTALQGNPALPAGRKVPAVNLHITLHFIGNTEAVGCLLEQAQQIQNAGFQLQIDRFGWFRRAGVAWAGCIEVPETLAKLAMACAEVSRNCGSPGDAVSTYTPHATLRRKVSQPPQTTNIEPVIWQVNSFHLLESRPLPTGGVYYASIGKFPLG